MVHVPYKAGGAGAAGHAGGRDSAGGGQHPASMPHFATGRIKPLAVFGGQRAQPLPDVPTIAEAGFPEPGMPLYSGGLILIAPTGTPPAVLARRRPPRATPRNCRRSATGCSPRAWAWSAARPWNRCRHLETSLPSVERLVRTSGARPNGRTHELIVVVAGVGMVPPFAKPGASPTYVEMGSASRAARAGRCRRRLRARAAVLLRLCLR